jgi:hypothetical protein
MKRLLCLAAAVQLCLTASLSGQSLAELAKKEKERRKKIEKKSEVVTEESLGQAEGSTLSTMGEDSTTTTDESTPSSPTKEALPEGSEAEPTKDGLSELRQSFVPRLSEATSRVEDAREELATCADRENRYVIDTSGAIHDMSRQRCAAARQRLSESQEALKQVQSQCMNEARKKNIVPGDARTVCYPRS